MNEIQSVAIVGMGALGLLFGSEIAGGLGPESVCFVADAQRVARYENQMFTINDAPHRFRMCDCQSAQPVDLLIVAVKYGALESSLDTMARCIGPQTIVISILNGISSEEIIARRYPDTCILYAVAQGMDAVKFGPDLRFTSRGELLLGVRDGSQQPQLAALTRFFDRAGVPYTVPADIRHAMWGKFLLNVGVNQTCMAYETNYGGVLAPGEARETMLAAMREVKDLGCAVGVALTEEDVAFYDGLLRRLAPEGMPSMRQDGVSRRPSEVEMFAGTVRAMCRERGLPCPTNDRLYDRIRAMEASYTA